MFVDSRGRGGGVVGCGVWGVGDSGIRGPQGDHGPHLTHRYLRPKYGPRGPDVGHFYQPLVDRERQHANIQEKNKQASNDHQPTTNNQHQLTTSKHQLYINQHPNDTTIDRQQNSQHPTNKQSTNNQQITNQQPTTNNQHQPRTNNQHKDSVW